MTHRQKEESLGARLKQSIALPVGFVSVLWIIHGVGWVLDIHMSSLGIYPREFSTLSGILTAPLIHGDLGHLFSNSGPLLILGSIIMLSYRKVAFRVFGIVWIMSGLGVWIFARESFHIGASGVAYGLVSFVFFSGIFRFDVKSIALALVVTFWYGSFVFGVFPGDAGISWESHLLGALAGALCGWVFRKVDPPAKYDWETEEEPPETGDEYWNYRNWRKTVR